MTGFIKQSLADLLREYPDPVKGNLENCTDFVTGIAYDSRMVHAGNVFVALEGISADGHDYIPQAVERGAVAVIGSRPYSTPVPYLQVEDTRKVLGYLSAALYRFPARRMTIIGVTGTDGKTTTTNLIYRILLEAGKRVGMVSTVNAVIGEEVIDTGYHVTTPEAPEVQRLLARMLGAGITHVVLEATSHGLAQQRVTACEFDVGVITNITHEHLDYHGSYEAYWEAKSRLFHGLSDTVFKSRGNPRLAVLNADDDSYEYLKDVTKVKQVAYSIKKPADIWAQNIRHSPNGLHFTVSLSGGEAFQIHSPFIGLHNVSNSLAAIGATVFGLGISPEVVREGIEGLKAIPGRMELIDRGQDFIAIVDFAHTPNALLHALQAAREETSGRVLTVFGSAGLRDRQKRRMMAQIAAEKADVTILTAEDPRVESLDDILEEMAQALTEKGGVEGKTFWRIRDRGEALLTAIRMAEPGDVVIACGKGHEQSMCFGETEYPWDDRVAMHAALARHLEQDGPEMPYLPTQDE